MRKLLAPLVGAFLLSNCPANIPAYAQSPMPQERCQPVELVLTEISKQVGDLKYAPLDVLQTARVVAWYNAQPPQSDDKFDLAIILILSGGHLGLILGNGDKACIASPIPDELVPSLLKVLEGTPA